MKPGKRKSMCVLIYYYGRQLHYSIWKLEDRRASEMAFVSCSIVGLKQTACSQHEPDTRNIITVQCGGCSTMQDAVFS